MLRILFSLRTRAFCVLAILTVYEQSAFTQQFTVPVNVTPGPIVNAAGFPVYGSFVNPLAVVPPVVAVADFNRDGAADVLAVYDPNNNGTSNSQPAFVMLLNNGDGTFTRHALANVVYPSDPTAFFSANVADINGDGKPDLVIINGSGETTDNIPKGPSILHAYIGQGDGTFTALAPQTVSSTLDSSILLASDLNGDSKADLVLVIFDNGDSIRSNAVFLNNGTGVFHMGPPLPADLSSNRVLAADIYGQGHADLVADNFLLKNDGTGRFTVGADIPPGAVIAVGDVNRDGRTDVIITSGGNPLVKPFTKALLNQGGGTFTESAFLNFDCYTGRVVDLNLDGRPDFIGGALAGLLVSFGNGDGTFSNPTIYSTTNPAAIADFNGDGNLDALFSQAAPFLLATGNAHGLFAAPRVTNTTQSPATNLSILAADFNGDKRTDVAVFNQPRCFETGPQKPIMCPGGTVAVTAGTGFDFVLFPKYFPVGVPAGVMAAGDVNGDGKMDIVVTRADNILPQQNSPVPFDTSVLLGRGDGTFLPAKNYHLIGYPNQGAPGNFDAAIFLLDVNKDGRLDLVGDWGVALGNGDGSFKAPLPLPSALTTITNMAAGDFNHDGWVDLEVGTFNQTNSTETLSTLLGNGTGSFTVAHSTTFTVPGFPKSEIFGMAAADLNGDGIPDLLYTGLGFDDTGASSGGLFVQLAHPDGTFAAAVSYPGLGAGGYSILTGDFNRDGLMDVLVNIQGAAGDLALFKGTGKGLLVKTPEFYASASYNNVGIPITTVNFDAGNAPDVASLVVNGFARVMNTNAR